MTTLADKLSRWKKDRMAFRKEAILLEDGTPFGEKIEKWQEEDFLALDSGKYQNAYLERPRGHSKTGDVGSEALTELILGKPGQILFCVAADEDQAKLLFDDVVGKLTRSDILRNSVKITKKEIRVKATGSVLKILSSDAPSAYGLRPDWIFLDELAEWKDSALWISLYTATGKRPNCRIVVISTAGWNKNSIAWEVRQIAETESNWYFSSRGQCASWIKKEWLDQQRRTLPAHVFARLHECRWVDGAGAWLSAAEVEAIFTNALPDIKAEACQIGVDLGITRDRSVVGVVKAYHDLKIVVVESLITWHPDSGRVDLQEIEEEILALAKKTGGRVMLDPWQGNLLAQRLRSKGIIVTEYNFTAERRRKLFSGLLDLIRTGRLKCRPHDALRRELLGLEVKELASGWRVDHKVGGHDDHVVAVALGALDLMPENMEYDDEIEFFDSRETSMEAFLERTDGGEVFVNELGDSEPIDYSEIDF